ncbi:MAG: exodeoxyribonuclease VII large subunit [Woeseiaceae bacterium]|nr:exodeoxyribonuclease VII large subunit [Woeseiaceae bacterium]
MNPGSVPPGADAATTLTVSELNRQARGLLERGLARVWVQGEISNLARPASGHVYFTLKDDAAQIRCAWFRQRQARGQAASTANGDAIIAFGRVSLYEARGDYQLIVEQIESAGEGELRRQFEALKKKLDAEGLFDPALKRPLPPLPRRIGVVTSPSGAAIRDILSVLRRRFPAVPVLLYPAAVQGDAAVAELIAALDTAYRRADCDVLIIGRGGGSLEDLKAFNDEQLARTIRRSPMPIVSAVGHEIDVSIADLVADLRAATPSGAAELVVPDRSEWLRALAVTRQRLVGQMSRLLEDRSQTLDWVARRLSASSPVATLRRQSEQLTSLQRALYAALRHDLGLRSRHAEGLRFRLLRSSPASTVERARHRLDRARANLGHAARRQLDRNANRLAIALRALDSVSPLATLGRGYAIVSDATTKQVITDAAALAEGAEIEARLARGRIEARVTRRYRDSDD